ncbi:MAG: hypothetical protein WBQ25_14390 [Nitrososphaeraceae archaeon]
MVKNGKVPVSHNDNFSKYHGNNAIFNLFCIPFFNKQTIVNANSDLLSKLFRYLYNCCKLADAAAKVTYMIPQFSWDKVPGESNAELLTSLKEVFGLENLDSASIKKRQITVQ